MTTDDQDRVSREAYDRSVRIPRAWVVTFAWSQHQWANQEDGQRTGPQWRPTRDDVEAVLNWKQLMTGQEP